MARKMARWITSFSEDVHESSHWNRIMGWGLIKRKRKRKWSYHCDTRARGFFLGRSFRERSRRRCPVKGGSREEANQAGTTSWQAAVLKVDCERGRGAEIKRETAGATSSLIVIWRLAPASRMLPQPVILILSSSSRRFRAEKRAKPW